MVYCWFRQRLDALDARTAVNKRSFTLNLNFSAFSEFIFGIYDVYLEQGLDRWMNHAIQLF